MDMAIVNAGMLGVYEEIPKDLLERVEDVILNRRPDATERLVDLRRRAEGRAPRRARAAGAVELEEDHAWRNAPRRGAPHARPRQGHRRLRRAGHRGGARQDTAKYPRPLNIIEGPAHGRHARRRRPLRRGQDVPAAGGQVRPGDEEVRRLPDPVHGGGEADARRRRRRRPGPTAGSSWPRSRATSTTSARTSSASSWPATTTRSSTSASWCPARRSFGRGAREAGRCDRPVRASSRPRSTRWSTSPRR